MRTIIVDDEQINLTSLELEFESVFEITKIDTFIDPAEALDYAKENKIDLAVLDIEMPGMNGIELAKRIKEVHPEILIIYVTAYKEYAFEAYQLEASAYILKPTNSEEIQRAIKKAKTLNDNIKKNVYIQTFGRFEVFVNNHAIYFNSAKAKELLALMVDRNGGIVTTEEAFTYLWEDKADSESNRSLCRKIVERLRRNLKEEGIEDIIIHYKQGRSIDKNKVTCDYFDYLENNSSVQFKGEYMSQYSWAEETLARLIGFSR